MFELSVALKYLIPKKRQLSVALIGIMSVGVISLVVWLVLVFLSVTEGIEKNWLKKLTDLNAPLKIVPTQKYYDSYFYRIDSISSESDYQSKTIEQKLLAESSDPYDPENDGEIPYFWPEKALSKDGTILDPIKILFSSLKELQSEKKLKAFQDFEMSAALLKLQLLRSSSPLFSVKGEEKIHFISQVSYISSIPDQNPHLKNLLISPSTEDIRHLLFLGFNQLDAIKSDRSPDMIRQTSSDSTSLIDHILSNIRINSLKTAHPFWQMPPSLLKEGASYSVIVQGNPDGRKQVIIPKSAKFKPSTGQLLATLTKIKGQLYLTIDGKIAPLDIDTPLYSGDDIAFISRGVSTTGSVSSNPLMIHVETTLQGHLSQATIPWKGLEIQSCEPLVSYDMMPKQPPLWTIQVNEKDSFATLPSSDKNEFPVVLPKSFQENGVLIGDRGYLSYTASTTTAHQEQRLGVFVAGFYDPGIMAVGNKCILAPKEVTRAINASNTSLSYDKISLAGVQVWLDDLSETDNAKQAIEQKLQDSEIADYFQVSSYKEYDFAKELLQQFQSDKYLFSLIAILIIAVACCNIISLLVLLVNDKKKEIGILMSMGATAKSIAYIFGLCGIIMGTAGCLLGCAAGYFTMHHIDVIVRFLSYIQGHDAFSATFFGSKLPSTLSSSATFFVLIITPILALIAGLIPAIKACSLRPASILRSQ